MNTFKKLFGSLFLLTIFPSEISANIQLDWEYKVGSKDFTPVANPPTDPIMGPQYGIKKIKVGASGHALALIVRSGFSTVEPNEMVPEETRLVMFDPLGKRIWRSDPLVSPFEDGMLTFNPEVHIFNVSSDSATLAFEPEGSSSYDPELVFYSINLNTVPTFTQSAIIRQRIADSNTGLTSIEDIPALPSMFPPNTFYTVGNPPGFMGGFFPESLGTIIRKYSLNTLASIPLVVASESGTNGNNFVIRWNSTANVSYQVQQSIDMTIWTDVGLALTGNGAKLSYSTPLGTGNKFYRIVQR